MNRTKPQLQRFAKSLMAYEAMKHESSDATATAAFRTTDKLHLLLASVMGSIGYRALLSRALALAGAEISWLRAVHVRADGTLAGLEALHAQLEPTEIVECENALLAQLLGLLVAFIGVSLTVRLVADIWPQVSPSDMELGDGEKNEEAT